MKATVSTWEFATRRRRAQDLAIEDLLPEVTAWLADIENADLLSNLRDAVAGLYIDTYREEDGIRVPRVERYMDSIDSLFTESDADSDPTTVATALAVSAINAATVQAADEDVEPLVLEWVTMHDTKVRESHKDVEGDQRPPGEPFTVDGVETPYPGFPVGPPSTWINCRCVLAPVLAIEATSLSNPATLSHDEAMTTGENMDETQTSGAPSAVPWHGVLAPEGVWSGDGRMFAEGSLTNREVPLPLTWQKTSAEGHDGSMVVARIDQLARVDGEFRGIGEFLLTPEADEVVGMVAEFGKFGVSVDADDVTLGTTEEEGRIVFAEARVSSASIVAIPAFAEAYIALGPAPEGFMGTEAAMVDYCDPESPDYDVEKCKAEVPDGMAGESEEFVSEEPWDGSASRFTPEQWKASCVMHVCDGEEKSCHKLPIKEPGGALSRAGVHAAAGRVNQTDGPPEAKASAKASLRGAYKQLGEEPPAAISAAMTPESFAETFLDVAPGRTEDGPGWLTHPVDTDRLRDYWTHGKGAAKIAWGTPGDFNRCRVNLAKYVKPQYLSGYCANRHFDALGFWPGEHRGKHEGEGEPFTYNGDPNDLRSISLVAGAADAIKAPAEWFENPHFTEPTHVTVTEEGRVFGHIAEWGTCHIGFDGVCIEPPDSPTDFAYYASKKVLLDNGQTARTGVISLGKGLAGHANHRLRPVAAIAHYDATATAVADVSAGRDEFGIWCAGWIRPGTTEEQIVALRASDVSGDWREIGGNLELVAALAVNSNGFPITPSARVEGGVQVSLVAAGVVRSEDPDDDPVDRLAEALATKMAERDARKAKMEALAARVEGEN